MKKNHVILNGIRSELIDGLLIQELPPIRKPLMRTQIEEIDGRDGSIVTNLGYSAYEREMLIGLYGEYDIDQVIRFFNSSGTAIFSNEPDKVYHYKILDEIDFERLAHFRVATVTFYVQPYKYSAVEDAIKSSTMPLYVVNSGNVPSKPKVTLTGTGTVTLFVNGTAVLAVALGGIKRSITIDAEEMDAYWNGLHLNRLVAGDYDDLTLNEGKNAITWYTEGSIDEVKVERYSRWV